METAPDKESLILSIRSTRRKWQATWNDLDEARLTQPNRLGAWSVKDMIAHVTWHEKEVCAMLHRKALLGSDLWNLPLEARNAAIYDLNKDRPLAEVLQEARQVYHELLDLLETLSEADLHEASHFKAMPPDWKPWEVIASNTYLHYPEHML